MAMSLADRKLSTKLLEIKLIEAQSWGICDFFRSTTCLLPSDVPLQ